jgi:hypothetical protein
MPLDRHFRGERVAHSLRADRASRANLFAFQEGFMTITRTFSMTTLAFALGCGGLSGCHLLDDIIDEIPADKLPGGEDIVAPHAKVKVPTLVGRAVLPAETFAPGPTSGTLLGAGPINGVAVPFVNKQPVQGFSAIIDNDDGTFWAMSDNGFGAQNNSADYHLRLYRIDPRFKTAKGGPGTVKVLEHIELRDPRRLAGFPIVNESTSSRVLTGADFDIESVQRAPNGDLWIGDEFGPFVLHFNAKGELISPPIPLPDFAGGGVIRAPQNPFYRTNDPMAHPPLAQVSGGFEGMALTRDGKRLLALLEKPLTTATERVLLISELDIASRSYTGVQYLYPLETRGQAIGDFIMYSARQGLVIERDNTQGDPAGFKAIYNITLPAAGGPVTKELLVDLMNIADPHDIATDVPGDVAVAGKTFGFPFVTIEDVVVLNPHEIGVLNDNNFPFSVGRHTGSGKPDDNEFIVVRLPKPLELW